MVFSQEEIRSLESVLKAVALIYEILITMKNITLMKPEHWPVVKKIYQEGIDTDIATFQELPPNTWEEWSIRHISNCSLVCLADDQIIG